MLQIDSFQYREIYVAAVLQHFEWNDSNFSRLCRTHAIVTSCTCHANG